jgi:hypothetical protein
VPVRSRPAGHYHVYFPNDLGTDEVESMIREQLAQISEFRGRRYDEQRAAPDRLCERIFEASSLSSLSTLPEYLGMCSCEFESRGEKCLCAFMTF